MHPVYSVSPASFYVKPMLCKQLALCALALSSLSGSPAGLAQCTQCAGSCRGRDWISVNEAIDTDWLLSWWQSQSDGGQMDTDKKGCRGVSVFGLSDADFRVNRMEN